MFIIATLVVLFLQIFAFSNNVFAADANWNGERLSYDGRNLDGPITAKANDKSTLSEGSIYYGTTEGSKGYFIYFPKGSTPRNESSASYITTDYGATTDKFSNPSSPEVIAIDTSTVNNDETIGASTCDVNGIGWVICPVSNWIAEGMDWMYGIIAKFLTVEPLTTNKSGLYETWSVVRDIANVCFVIGFLILIYGQVSGGLLNNYTIKKTLPRIIIAAILVNVSYLICTLAVDLSNILGAAVQDMFMAMNDRLGLANSSADDIGWVKVTGLVLGGGSLATLGIIAASGGSVGAMSLLLIAALIPALFAVLVAVIILAARQALITILIIIAPLAFVAYLLPNTEEWFDRWRKLFIALMVMFPAFSVIFGGAQLAGKIIIQNANSLPVVILGLIVQVIPLFVTPFLIKLSSGLMGTIAGMTNNKGKGIFDKTQNSLRNQAQARRSAAIAKGLDRLNTSPNKNKKRRQYMSAAYIASGGQRRDVQKQRHEAAAASYNEALVNDSRGGKRAYESTQRSNLIKDTSANRIEQDWSHKLTTDTAVRALYLNTKLSEHQKENSETNAKRMMEEIYAKGSSAPDIHNAVDGQSKDAARALQDIHLAHEVQEREINNAKIVQSEHFQKALIENTNGIRRQAGGIRKDAGGETVLSEAVAKARNADNERIKEKEQLINHFKLSGSERMDLGLNRQNVTSSDGNYTFDYSDPYTKEAVLNVIANKGSAGEKRQIVESSGPGGFNNEYRSTISDMVASSGLANSYFYLGSKTIDDIGKGEYDITKKNDAIIFHVSEGKVKQGVLATQAADSINDLKAVKRSAQYRALSAVNRAKFDDKYEGIKEMARAITTDKQLSASTEGATLKALEDFLR